MPNLSTSPPRRLAIAVACVAAAMLLVEIAVTRLFSVLFFYHFSFFAVTLVMSGLVAGGVLAARWDARTMPEADYANRLSALGAFFAGATIAALVGVIALARPDANRLPSLPVVALYALAFLPGLVAAGGFLALAFARDREWIGTLYAWDLVAAAAACVAAIFLLRTVQGPAVLLVPALLAALACQVVGASRTFRTTGLAFMTLAAGLLIVDAAASGQLLRLRTAGAPPIFERWNEHSRIQAFDSGAAGRYLVIDKTAGTMMRPIPPEPDGAPVRLQEAWAQGAQYPVYSVGRPVRSVAIIGVGGGSDLLPPLWYGAEHVDGYELNGILVDLLERDFRDFNAVTSRPEVRLVHDEARVGISRSGKQYDVIQASLIDTWAATASGGFVLSENGLYTREGWHTFLSHLSDAGILTMTRWHLADAPAETERLVSLAAAALEDAGFPDATPHIVLIRSSRNDKAVSFTKNEGTSTATILVSKAPFTAEEIARLQALCVAGGMEILAAPAVVPRDPTIAALLVPATREQAVATSTYDISPPTDLQPYFFLQVRPGDLVNLSRKSFGAITEITFNGVRVLMLLGACALALVLAVALLTALTLPGSSAEASQRGVYRRMTLYFLGIGLGYILVQLALHQRLTIVLGHPTFALSVVLFSMLLGTGIGAALSARLFPSGRLLHAGLVILAALAILRFSLPLAPYLSRIDSNVGRVATVGLVLAAVGFVLGFAFPLGVRRVAPTGEWAVQKMWAINGAASIAASVLAALVGLTMGSGAVLTLGLICYGAATVAGALAESRAAEVAEPERAEALA